MWRSLLDLFSLFFSSVFLFSVYFICSLAVWGGVTDILHILLFLCLFSFYLYFGCVAIWAFLGLACRVNLFKRGGAAFPPLLTTTPPQFLFVVSSFFSFLTKNERGAVLSPFFPLSFDIYYLTTSPHLLLSTTTPPFYTFTYSSYVVTMCNDDDWDI